MIAIDVKSKIDAQGFVCCPLCGRKTKQKVRKDTWTINLPLFCPKCKCLSLVDIENSKITVKTIEPRKD